MSSQDDLYYLQPGFDLSSLKVAQIRNILVEHDITYPSSAKKQELIEVLEQNVIPKSKKLLKAQARIKRTSRGIEDVPSSQESLDDEDDKEKMPPPPPRTPRSRKSRSNLIDEDGSVAPTPKSTRKSKTPTGRRSVRKPRESDTETELERPQQSARKTRKSTPPAPVEPAVRIEEPKFRRSTASEDSPFTTDNPFQSGSSPPSEPPRVSTSRSRKSIDGRKSTSRRRETTSPVIKREIYDIPVSHLDIDRNGVEITEEFTPDADRELQQDLASDKQLVHKRNSALMRHRKQPTSTATKSAPFVILTGILGLIGGWYRQEKINIGYCGVGESDWSLASNSNIPPWVHEQLQPRCEPCPQHAICYTNMEVRCEDDFVLQPHPLSLSGLVPLPPTCEPDSEKQRRIKAVADRAVEELREQRAAWECGDTSITAETTQTVATKLEIPEEALKTVVSKQRRRGMEDHEFEDLWRGALGDIISREEVEVTRDGSGRRYLSSNSLARLPFTCAIRRSAIRTISEYRLLIASVILLLAGLGYGRHRVVTFNQAKSQTPSLVAMTLDRLATQAALKEGGRVQEGFISVGQLRDDVLRNVFNARERERAWARVQKIVEGNSNIRAATREGEKTGEWSRVWEWIGPVDLTSGLGGRRSILNRSSDSDDDTRSGLEVRKWNEGRPIY